jgi:membrane dipeptidase
MSLSRRSLLALSAAAAASPAIAAKAADPLAGLTVINALGGLIDPNTPDLPRVVMTKRILADAHASGMTAVNCTFGPNT